ncbi:alpha-amylase family glycosyl hydrolase [Mycoplasma corogypsi]|uniref:alpha-amylase family glycosyl hydrolase n=1 Tax=Mycoplasma corogypsi TaxID=2106 RepID=UPI0038730CF6
MNINWKNDNDFSSFDAIYSDKNAKLGVSYEGDTIFVRLWQPLAKKVEVLIFEKDTDNRPVQIIPMYKKDHIWTASISSKYDGKYYQFRIVHHDDTKTIALDPYAYSLGRFNWEGDETRVGKGAFVNLNSEKAGNRPVKLLSNLNNKVDPLIYELHIRDFTSLLNQENKLERLGTFNAALEEDIFGYLRELNVTHLQLLPVHSTYTVNDFETKIYQKGEGNGWLTNYNWGYDPHNYFALNGIYSTDPSDPYARIREFRTFVNEAHKNGVSVILDVVYNHMMTNNIYNNVMPNYYYRNEAEVKPVNYPPLADERVMVKKIILDSLKYYVKEFNVDGFRFDLSSFLHGSTLNEIATELRKLNPNIVLHGEAWKFTDIPYENTYVKGITGNNISFAYFNDTVRNATKGSDEEEDDKGLIIQNDSKHFDEFLASVVGGISYPFTAENNIETNPYDSFANDVAINLSYSHCHDGMTLWDKINVSSFDLGFDERIFRYRQALMMTTLTQGRQLMLAGTELLQSKPNDITGMDGDRTKQSHYDDEFYEYADGNRYHLNSYKTTDYVNGLKWAHLQHPMVRDLVFDFTARLNKFRNETKFFRLSTNKEILESLKFVHTNKYQGIIIFEVTVDNKTVVVIHNFSEQDYKYIFDENKVILSSRTLIKLNKVPAHTSLLLWK